MRLNCLIALFLISLTVHSQDSLSLFKKAKEQVKISGGFSSIGTAYMINDTSLSQRDPFFWQLGANINIKIGQVSIPFSAVMNQQERNFTQPFNQYGLSPKYKGITAHLGYRSLKFSDFSLSGNQFLGVGIEIAPKNSIVKGKALYGRFARAVDGYYTDGKVVGSPSFERWGLGGMVEIGSSKNNVGVVVFRAKDDQASIASFANDATIKPGENLIFGLTTKQKLSKELSFKGEIDWSAFTKDLRLDPTVLEGFSYLNNIEPLFHANASSSFSKAVKADLEYNKKKFKVGFGYRRIDPEYQTMGSVYLNNDFEDLQGKTSLRMLKNKLTLAGSAGFQRNNLDDSKASEMLRLISSLSANYNINENFMVNGAFSNFNSQSHMAIVNTLDTMRYAQVTKNANLQLMYAKANDVRRIAASVRGNFQNAKINGLDNTTLYNGGVSFQYGHLKSGLNVVSAINASKNITETYDIVSVGPTLGLNKRFLSGRISASASASALKTFLGGADNGYVLNVKSMGTFKLNRHHAFNLIFSTIGKNNATTDTQETTISLGYNYAF